MKTISLVLAVAAMFASAHAAEDGFVEMFNGKDLTGWQTTGNWMIAENNVLTLKPRPGESGWKRYNDYIATEKQYGDFILDLEFKIDKGGNSGVFMRVGDLKDHVNSGFELQIIDTHGLANPGHHDCGGIIKTQGPLKNMAKPAGEWNRYVITLKGNHLTVVFNGEEIQNLNLSKGAMKDRPAKGHISFQDEGKRVWYRNVRIKDAESAVKPRPIYQKIRIMFKSLLTFSLLCVSVHPARAHDAKVDMEKAAKTFLAALSDEQKARTKFDFNAPFTDTEVAQPASPPKDERRNWHYVPRPRRGLPIKDMTTEQRLLAHGLLATGLSHRGYNKAVGIMSLESVLAALENNPKRRDPELYYLSVFGTPGKEPWGWRVEGHHLSLNFTIAGGEPVMTPSFFGTNPGEVKQGPRMGTRVLEAEEELGRTLVKSLDEAQRKKAVILEQAPKEIINVPGRNDTKPEGIPWTGLTEPQRETLTKLIREYLFRHRPEVAEAEFAKVMEKSGALHFAWAGGLERGEPHYYRVQGGGFVLEYDNVQNGANHVHSVWRDFDRDFGADVLEDHYKAAHGK